MLACVTSFIKRNTVFVIAVFAAALTSLIVPPDSQYLTYFDFKTLTCLFCVLAVVCALKNVHFFYILAQKIVEKFSNLRRCTIALVYITFIGSMLIANDMALLTFLPLGYLILTATGKEKYMAIVFILQNIAANLGGMLTPFGNPQKLFIDTKFNIPTAEFVEIMLPPFALSIVLITACCFLIKPENITFSSEKYHADKKKTIFYLVLFALSIIIVFRVIPYWIGLAVIPLCLLFSDRKALLEIDYGLLGTFAAFFVFAGNMSRIPVVRQFFSALLEKSTLVFSVVSCQLISNVPSAILLSQFTENYRELLLGVNIGGAGTLIASLASLITFREYIKSNPGEGLYYTGLFSAFNFSFVIILTVFMLMIS